MKCLLESTGKYNFKNVTPEAVAAQVCADVQMPVGELAATGINIKSMLCNDKAIYDIIIGRLYAGIPYDRKTVSRLYYQQEIIHNRTECYPWRRVLSF